MKHLFDKITFPGGCVYFAKSDSLKKNRGGFIFACGQSQISYS